MHPKINLAYFVSSHGFGHAARSCAVMNAIFKRWPFVRFDIFTRTPEWFFKNSLAAPFVYHSCVTDVGLVQTDPLHFDPDKTIAALEGFLPFHETILSKLADQLCANDCHLVVSDISPLGIAVAERSGIFSVLVENFTWDWIYADYVSTDRRFKKYIDLLAGWYSRVDQHVQASPVCNPIEGRVRIPPVSRPHATDPAIIRERLGLGPREKMVLISMGGIPGLSFMHRDGPLIRQLKTLGGSVRFVIPGAGGVSPDGFRQENMIFLPPDSGFYHPDLVNAADAVVGKLGYSTLAEVYHAGCPFGFVARDDFRESPVFEAFVREKMTGVKLFQDDFTGRAMIGKVLDLLALPKRLSDEPNGADAAALHICDFLACEKEILEIVDTDGAVVGAAPRKCVHGDNRLLHRVVHVLVRDAKDRLLLQKRSQNKRVAPGRWDTSVGGHVDCGESIETAMYREMAEELGIRPERLEFAYHYIHSNHFESELVFTYTCRYDGKISHHPEEIEAVKFWDIGEIETAIGTGVLSDNFEDEFRRFQRWQKRAF